MDEQERQYLIEDARRMELWEETPTAPSGRCSDMTDVEKEKLIDLLFAKNDTLESTIGRLQATIERQGRRAGEQMDALRSQLQRMEERAMAAERRAEQAEKRADMADKRIAELTSALTAIILKI